MNPEIMVWPTDYGVTLYFYYRESLLGQADLSFDAVAQLLRLLRLRARGNVQDSRETSLTVTPIGPATRIRVFLQGQNREWLMLPETAQGLIAELSKHTSV